MSNGMGLIARIFFRLVPASIIEAEFRKQKLAKSAHGCQLHSTSRFYEDSSVLNLQHDPRAIVIKGNTHIRGHLQVFAYGGSISIGSNCYIGENSYVWSGDKIVIGNNVLISHGVNIIDSNSHEINHLERADGYASLLKNGHPKVKGSIETQPITIEDHAWISFGAIILKGVTVGEGAIVGAGSVVTRNVPPFTLVAGNPASVIKSLNK